MRLDRNLRQSRAEEKVLGEKGTAQVARPLEAQPSRGTRPFWRTDTRGISMEYQGEDLVEI